MNIALILAGGQGARMGSDVPKQFLPLYGKPVIMYSMTAFQNHPMIDEIYIVCQSDWVDRMNVLFNSEYGLTKLKKIIAGGETRKQSSYNGLVEIERCHSQDDVILIHDSARPLITERIITDNITSVLSHDASATVIPSTDTILMSLDGEMVLSGPPRSTLFSAQTPQSFKLGLILSAHRSFDILTLGTENSQMEITDDAGLLLNQDIPVKLVLGDKKNIKITTQEDIAIVSSYLK